MLKCYNIPICRAGFSLSVICKVHLTLKHLVPTTYRYSCAIATLEYIGPHSCEKEFRHGGLSEKINKSPKNSISLKNPFCNLS